MTKATPRFYFVALRVLLLTTVFIAYSPIIRADTNTILPSSATPDSSTISSSSVVQPIASSTPSTTRIGITSAWVNVRTAPSTSASIDHVDPPNTTETIYATVSGKTISSGNFTWYRIAPLTSAPLYIYSNFVEIVSNTLSDASEQGKIIVVSLSQQELYAYDHGKLFILTPVATGRPELPTPTGTYHIFSRYSPYIFISPWPVGSPYYYATATANYALEWAQGGYFLHDAPWRGYFGQGANNWHKDTLMGEDPGTHGCINVPTAVMVLIYNWATIGTTLQTNA